MSVFGIDLTKQSKTESGEPKKVVPTSVSFDGEEILIRVKASQFTGKIKRSSKSQKPFVTANSVASGTVHVPDDQGNPVALDVSVNGNLNVWLNGVG